MKKNSILLFWVLGISVFLCWCEQNVIDSDAEVKTSLSESNVIETGSSLSSENKIMKEVISTWDLIVVDYVWKHLDWTAFDTSIESVAKEAWKYNPSRDYTAWLEFTAGAGQMIKWFDEAVICYSCTFGTSLRYFLSRGWNASILKLIYPSKNYWYNRYWNCIWC